MATDAVVLRMEEPQPETVDFVLDPQEVKKGARAAERLFDSLKAGEVPTYVRTSHYFLDPLRSASCDTAGPARL